MKKHFWVLTILISFNTTGYSQDLQFLTNALTYGEETIDHDQFEMYQNIMSFNDHSNKTSLRSAKRFKMDSQTVYLNNNLIGKEIFFLEEDRDITASFDYENGAYIPDRYIFDIFDDEGRKIQYLNIPNWDGSYDNWGTGKASSDIRFIFNESDKSIRAERFNHHLRSEPFLFMYSIDQQNSDDNLSSTTVYTLDLDVDTFYLDRKFTFEYNQSNLLSSRLWVEYDDVPPVGDKRDSISYIYNDDGRLDTMKVHLFTNVVPNLHQIFVYTYDLEDRLDREIQLIGYDESNGSYTLTEETEYVYGDEGSQISEATYTFSLDHEILDRRNHWARDFDFTIPFEDVLMTRLLDQAAISNPFHSMLLRGYSNETGYRFNYHYSPIDDTATEDFNESISLGVSIYPNPFTESVRFDCKSCLKRYVFISIYDSAGRLCFESEIDIRDKLNLSTLEEGIYYYTIKVDGEKKQSGRIVKVE